MRLEAGREYSFYIGTTQMLLADVLHGLSSVDKFVFGRGEVVVDCMSYELEYVNVEAEAEGVNRPLESSGASVKVVFESPTLLKDPLAIGGPAPIMYRRV